MQNVPFAWGVLVDQEIKQGECGRVTTEHVIPTSLNAVDGQPHTKKYLTSNLGPLIEGLIFRSRALQMLPRYAQ